jgi:hypothetical protein
MLLNNYQANIISIIQKYVNDGWILSFNFSVEFPNHMRYIIAPSSLAVNQRCKRVSHRRRLVNPKEEGVGGGVILSHSTDKRYSAVRQIETICFVLNYRV